MSPDDRQALLEQFRTYLEQQPGDDVEEGSLPGEIDLYRLFSELGALKNEVRLESRQFKTALQQFGELFETLRKANDRLSDELNRQREQAARQHTAIERPLLLEMLTLRDSLATGLRSARGYSPGWLARRLKGERRALSDLRRGQEITLQKLDAVLEGHGVARIKAEGERLDPHRMQVVAIEEREGAEDGQVVEIIRDGYNRGIDLLRPVEVVVNKSEKS